MAEETKTASENTAAAVAQQKQEAGAKQASATPKLHNISGSSDKTNKTWLEHKSSPEVDRERAFKKIREYAAKHGGLCTGLTGQDGKPLTDPNTGKAYTPEALIEAIKYTNATKVDASGNVVEGGMRCAVRGPGIGPNGSNVFEFVETPNVKTLQKSQEQVQKKEEEKGGFWNWCKRNLGWIVAGTALLGAAAAWIFRKKKVKTNTITIKEPVQQTPGTSNNGKPSVNVDPSKFPNIGVNGNKPGVTVDPNKFPNMGVNPEQPGIIVDPGKLPNMGVNPENPGQGDTPNLGGDDSQNPGNSNGSGGSGEPGIGGPSVDNPGNGTLSDNSNKWNIGGSMFPDIGVNPQPSTDNETPGSGGTLGGETGKEVPETPDDGNHYLGHRDPIKDYW